jgi:hypothetical protein
MNALSREPCVNSEATVLSIYNLLPGNDSFIAIRCSGDVISNPLLSNGRLLQLHNSGFEPSCHNIHTKFYVDRFGIQKLMGRDIHMVDA